MDWTNKALGLDISLYNTVTDWALLAKSVDFVIAKCSEGETDTDPKFADNCQKAYDNNIPFGAYHYFKPWWYTQLPFPDTDEALKKWPSPANDPQLQNLIKALRFKTFNFLAVDLERYGNEGIDKQWFSAAAKIFVGRVSDWLKVNHPTAQLLVYTSNNFIDEFAPNINNWIAGYNSWIAYWYYRAGNVTTSWESLKAQYPASDWKFGYFSTRPTWELVQWSGDRFHLPGLTGAVDLNFYNGTPEQFREWVKFTEHEIVTPPPEPVYPTYTVKVDILLVRSAPKFGNNMTGITLKKGETVSILETRESLESDGLTYRWGRHDRGWSCIEAVKPYMVKA